MPRFNNMGYNRGMKLQKAGRKRRSGVAIRPLLRISEQNKDLYDRYSDEERSEVFDRALASIFPKQKSSNTSPTLIRPKVVKTGTACRVVLHNQWIRLFFPEKRDDFRSVVKAFRYVWNGCWEREFSASADIVDRAAEIANEIMLLGLCIQLECPDVQKRLLSNSFVPESFKTIKRSLSEPYKDWFVFDWPKSDDCYSEIMKLAAARYSNGSVHVPKEHFIEVQDFAEINDFTLSEGAIALASEAEIARDSAIIINPKRKSRKGKKKNELPDNAIPKHLRDDDDD